MKIKKLFVSHAARDHIDCMTDLAATRTVQLNFGFVEDDLQKMKVIKQGSFARTTTITAATRNLDVDIVEYLSRDNLALLSAAENRTVILHEVAHHGVHHCFTETWERRSVSFFADIFLSPRAREEWLGDLDENRRDLISKGRPRLSIILATLRMGFELVWAFVAEKWQDLRSLKKEQSR